MKILKALLISIPLLATAVFALFLYLLKPEPGEFDEFATAAKLSISAETDDSFTANGRNFTGRDFLRFINVIMLANKDKAESCLKEFPSIIVKPQMELVMPAGYEFHKFQELIQLLTRKSFASLCFSVKNHAGTGNIYTIPIPLPVELTGKPDKAVYVCQNTIAYARADSCLIILREENDGALQVNHGVYAELLKAQKQSFNEKTGELKEVEIPFTGKALIQKTDLDEYISLLKGKYPEMDFIAWYMPLAETRMQNVTETLDVLLRHAIRNYEFVLTEH